MKLRTSRVLKILAILLFSLESLAPTIFSEQSGPPELVNISSFEKTLNSHSLLLSLYTEACDTEERTDANERQIILLTDQLAAELSLKFAEKALSHSFFLSRQERDTLAPPLFVLHCTYLI